MAQLTVVTDRQLRPKVNNYALTVEKGEGYDFNMSLFERLVLKDYPRASFFVPGSGHADSSFTAQTPHFSRSTECDRKSQISFGSSPILIFEITIAS